MLQRLRSGNNLTVTDINFYLHELKESAIMARGAIQGDAHKAALEWQGIPWVRGYEAKLYHPDVMRAADGGLSAWSEDARRGAGLE